MVTKSAVKKTLATPSISSSSPSHGSSGAAPLTWVPGPPTDSPTENLRAFGFGVLSTATAMPNRA